MPKEQLKIEDGYKWFKDQKYEDGKPKYIFDKVEDIPDDFNIEDGIKEFEDSLDIDILKDIDMNKEIDNLKTELNEIENNDQKSDNKIIQNNINFTKYDINTIKIYIYYTKQQYIIKKINKNTKYKKLRAYFVKVINYYINSYLYLKQLNYEKNKLQKQDKIYKLELSKKILDNTEITKNIINKYKSFYDNYNYKIENIPNQIFIPKIIKNIKLNHIFGLFKLKIKKLLKNNNLNICISKYNFKLKLRSFNELLTIEGILNKLDKENLKESFSKYYILYRDNNDFNYIINSIIDINFDFKKIVDDLANCKDRYYFILGSQGSFNKNWKTSLSDIIGMDHRISLIFDKQKKRIYFYDPINLEQYISDKYGNKINAYYLIFSYLFDAEITNIDYFKKNKYTVVVFKDIETQYKEHKSNNLIIKELQSIENYWKGTKDRNLDWGGGYCGLWNLLLITMLNINPDKDIEDIFAFYQKLLNHENENKQIFLIKTLIRSFAYHIEQLLNGKKDTIPIVKLNVNSIDGDKLKFESINLEANKAVSEISNISIKEHDNSVKDEDRDKYKDIKDSDYKQKIIPFLSEFTKTLLKKGNPLKTESNPEIANYEERQDALHNKILFIL